MGKNLTFGHTSDQSLKHEIYWLSPFNSLEKNNYLKSLEKTTIHIQFGLVPEKQGSEFNYFTHSPKEIGIK